MYWKTCHMMEKYGQVEIQEMPLGVQLFRRKTEDFLAANGLRLEGVDLYLTVQDSDGQILAGGGLQKDVIKCVAVSQKARSGGFSAPLVSELIARGMRSGYRNLKVFTKPENESIFSSMGFRTLARAPKAILMENGQGGLEDYLQYLRDLASKVQGDKRGVIIMNANPFTIGHRYLVEQASRNVEHLFVMVVAEDVSDFSYAERLDMVRKGCEDFANVTVCEGCAYQISRATFPTYFLKELSDASSTQMLLDLDLFASNIAPALGAKVRFAGSEPSDALTAEYNSLMAATLPGYEIEFQEISRLVKGANVVSASVVRQALENCDFNGASSLVPPATRPYLMAVIACKSLEAELQAPLKPGLVCKETAGAHKDMDYGLMVKSIAALRPYFAQIPSLVQALPGDISDGLLSAGKAAEEAMLRATDGVNTHQGAIFALGLLEAAVASVGPLGSAVTSSEVSESAASIAWTLPDTPRSKQWEEMGLTGPLGLARRGYRLLFGEWLPYYRSVKKEEYALQKTLVRIMSSLDDTCIVRRKGLEAARQIKQEASALTENFSAEGLSKLDMTCCEMGVSPGGAADMLALTIFADSLNIV